MIKSVNLFVTEITAGASVGAGAIILWHLDHRAGAVLLFVGWCVLVYLVAVARSFLQPPAGDDQWRPRP